ncbi:hypothetical protein MNQ98_27220 [Paenibacillus sp. N3/727]|uniref:hypothetical protein n=1 Tax=Paenibacillus sp. N3/727 TaxID=2925845 RepID=UPI001F532975|nr:hypothetical protein [Paenibacillus sp. N3/727]UNK18061.1 hypothetical protein MNQ98_27220 [Paenibacillus sp. N3/727]
MDNLILNLEKLSQSVLEQLDQTTYEELVAFVESRQPILDEMSVIISNGALSQHQRDRIQKLLHNDMLIEARMRSLKQEASDWLRQRDAAKIQRNAYESAYSVDSLLMDQRK